MNITVINGSSRHGSTWHCMDLVRQEIAVCEETSVNEFFSKAMPEFCSVAFLLFNGEQTCPHADSIEPIVRALKKRMHYPDLFGVCPGCAGPMKSWLDHLCFMWGSHRRIRRCSIKSLDGGDHRRCRVVAYHQDTQNSCAFGVSNASCP